MAPRYKQSKQLVSDRQHFLAGYSLDGLPLTATSNSSGASEKPHYGVDLLPSFLFDTTDGVPVDVDVFYLNTESADVPADAGMYGVIEYLWTLVPYGRSAVISPTSDAISGRLHCRVSRGTCQGIELVPQTHTWSSQIQLYPEIAVVSSPTHVNTLTLKLQVDAALPVQFIFNAVRTVLIRVASPKWGYEEPQP